jgi:DNA polymerase-3 subunit beta
LRFAIDQAALAPALATVARAAPSRAVRPVLSAVLLRAGSGGVTLTATDMERAVVTTVPAEVEEEGAVALPARYLQEVVRRIPSGPITVVAEPEAAGARLLWQRSHFAIHGFPVADFPAVPAFPERPDWLMPQSSLRRLIVHAAFAAAPEGTQRALLTGVELRFGEAGAAFALATDGFQIAAYATHPDAPRPADGGLVVPASALAEVARVLADSVDPCEIALVGNRLLVRAGPTVVSSRLLEGKYYAVLDMLPKAYPTRVRVARDALTGACERVGLVSESEPPHAITLVVGPDAVRMTAQSAAVGEAEEELPAEVVGPELAVWFNGRQLLQGLRHFEGPTVDIEFSGATTLSRLTDPDDRRLQYLQMPLQLEGVS